MTRALLIVNARQTLNVHIDDNCGVTLGRDAEEIKAGGSPTLTFLTGADFEQIVTRWLDQKTEMIARAMKLTKKRIA